MHKVWEVSRCVVLELTMTGHNKRHYGDSNVRGLKTVLSYQMIGALYFLHGERGGID